MFTPYRSATALYVPPIPSRMLLSSAGAWEKIGQRWFTSFAGVVVVEASKQIFAGHGAYEVHKRRVYVPVAAASSRALR